MATTTEDRGFWRRLVLSANTRDLTVKFLLVAMTALSAFTLVWQFVTPEPIIGLQIAAGVTFTITLLLLLRIILDPDGVRALQTDAMLKLARQMFACVRSGMDERSALKICELMYPETAAFGVALDYQHQLLGVVGFEGEPFDDMVRDTVEAPICAKVLETKAMVISSDPEEIGKAAENPRVNAVIAVPLIVNRRLEGLLLFYYRRLRQITATQKSIAEGLGQLLSTQLAADSLEAQSQLATSMELKALQNQINPHFLFNTINTIASLVRTDPMRARNLLREFAVFYRRTLEDSADLIMLSREAEQVVRYFNFEVARFGEDRVELILDEGPEVKDMLVPPFLIQPLVENAVRHGMPSEGKLTVIVRAYIEDGDLIIKVIDNGVGMTQEACENIMHPEASTGMGIAVKNVHDRLFGYFGPESKMEVESELGKGTTVTLVLHNSSE